MVCSDREETVADDVIGSGDGVAVLPAVASFIMLQGAKKHINIIFLMISPPGWENIRRRFLGTFWASPGPGTGPKCSPKT